MHTHVQALASVSLFLARSDSLNKFVTTREAAWYIILVTSVCLYVCLSDDNFESLDVGSSYLHTWYISTDYESSSYMKVIGSRSRLQEAKRSKIPISAV